MRPLALLTVILCILCFFVVNMAMGDDTIADQTITEDWFVNGDPGDKDYNYDDVGFDALESDSYLAGIDKDDRQPTAKPAPPKLRKEKEKKALKDKKEIYNTDVEDPLG